MRVACIGCGGIGSFFAAHIDQLIDTKQIVDVEFIFFDYDKVETKNILYQNFDPGDIDSLKTSALELKLFNIEFQDKKVTLEDLKDFSLIVLCADNNTIRNEALAANKAWGIPFIDARANGKTIGIFSSNTENYESTLDGSTEGQSCQNPFQLDNKQIEYGNVIVAAILAQCVLTYCRTTRLPNDLMINF